MGMLLTFNNAVSQNSTTVSHCNFGDSGRVLQYFPLIKTCKPLHYNAEKLL